MLPLEELTDDVFIINANTRGINVPNNFKKNGIAVQGDHAAEVVYFKIDRYFDMHDLSLADIYIQWETPKGPDGVIKKGFSLDYCRDIEREPGKLIFGWALSKEITEIPGNLKFSVRFYKFEDNQVTVNPVLNYSLATLNTTVMINPGLNLDIKGDKTLVKDDIGADIIAGLENSPVLGGKLQAAAPVFLEDGNLPAFIDLGAEGGEYQLTACAAAEGTGEIVYRWYRVELVEDETTPDKEGLSGTVIYEPATNIVENDKRIFYYQNGTGHSKYISNIPPTAEDLDEYGPLYVKVASYTAKTIKDDDGNVVDSGVGIYQVVAENRVSYSATPTESNACVVPKPTNVVFTTQPVANGILNDDNTGLELSAAALIPESEPYDAKNQNVQVYQWYRDTNSASSVTDETATWTKIPDADEAVYAPDAPGHYKVEITNKRNAEKKSAFSSMSRVTYSPKHPTMQRAENIPETIDNSKLSDNFCPAFVVDDATVSDFYTVQWFFKENEDSEAIAATEPATDAFKFNPGTEAASGTYYPVVINNLNTQQSTAIEGPAFIIY